MPIEQAEISEEMKKASETCEEKYCLSCIVARHGGQLPLMTLIVPLELRE